MNLKKLLILSAVLALGNIYGMDNSLIARGEEERGGEEQFHEGGRGGQGQFHGAGQQGQFHGQEAGRNNQNLQPAKTDAAFHAGQNSGYNAGAVQGAPAYYAPPPEYYPNQNPNQLQNQNQYQNQNNSN